MSYMDLDAHVNRGAELLDRNRLGWRSEVELRKLDMNSAFMDILGQLYNTWATGLAELNLSVEQSIEYGFSLDTRHSDRHSELTEAWKKAILNPPRH